MMNESTKTEKKPQSEIEKQMLALNDSIATLTNTVAELRNRLNLVLSDAPKDETAPAPETYKKCPLAGHIEDANLRINTNVENIRKITELLEI